MYTSIAGYSPESVDARRPGFDFAIQGEAGGMSITGEPDGPPLKVGVAIADITTGMFAAIGTLAALRDGRAHAAGGTTCRSPLRLAAGLAREPRLGLRWSAARSRTGSATPTPRSCPYEAFATSDGYVIVAIGTNEQFARFCAAAGLAELAGDARYATNAAARRAPARARRAPGRRDPAPAHGRLAGECSRPRTCPGGPVRTIPEAFAHAPYAVVEHAHPLLGAVRTVRSPIGLDGDVPHRRRRAAAARPAHRARCSPSSATTTTRAPPCWPGPAGWPERFWARAQASREPRGEPWGVELWVASPLPPGSSSSRARGQTGLQIALAHS